MKFRPFVEFPDTFKQGLIGFSDQDILLSGEHAAHDAFHMFRVLAARENHFRETLAERTVMVNLGVAELLIGQVTQAVHGVFYTELSAAQLAQHFGDFFSGQQGLRVSQWTGGS